MKRKLTLRRLINYFLGGLLIVLPLSLTAYFISWIFTSIDTLIDTQSILGESIPGLGVLAVIVLITSIGFIAEGWIFKPILDFLDHVVERIPGVKIIYSFIKDFMEAFVGEKKKFNEPVAVEMNNGLLKLGFVTQKDLSGLGLKGYVSVYFPHSYNFSGNVFLVPSEKVKPVQGNPSEIMKFVASGGVTTLGDDTTVESEKAN
ncbi:MAG: DUF502 domain-containing protein [Bacteroidetes bacterium]|nr:MAG: DUF502 domain-containing protein [Bacteroidota bacterium]